MENKCYWGWPMIVDKGCVLARPATAAEVKTLGLVFGELVRL